MSIEPIDTPDLLSDEDIKLIVERGNTPIETKPLPIINSYNQQSQDTPTQAHENATSLNMSSFFESTLDNITGTFSSRFNPFAKKLSKSIDQARQYAQEKMGKVEDITILPEEYRELEKKVDNYQKLYDDFLKISKIHQTPNYDYPVQLQDSLIGITNTVTTQIQQFAHQPEYIPFPVSDHPKTLIHAFGRVALNQSNEIGSEEPLGKALTKLGETSYQVGDARLTLDQTIVNEFNIPIQTSLKTKFEATQKSRRFVQFKRLALDAAKTKYRESGLDEIRLEVEEAEKRLLVAIEEASRSMDVLLADPEPFNYITNYVQAQLDYFKRVSDLYSSLLPELKEIKEAQSSLHCENQ